MNERIFHHPIKAVNPVPRVDARGFGAPCGVSSTIKLSGLDPEVTLQGESGTFTPWNNVMVKIRFETLRVMVRKIEQ